MTRQPSAQERAAKLKGYTVWTDDPDSHGNRYRFTTPAGNFDSAPHFTESAAWASAFAHMTRDPKP